MSINELSDYLTHLGIKHEKVAEKLIKAYYKGVFGTSKVMVQLRDSGLRVAINPVLSKPDLAENWSGSVEKLITRLNKESANIRIALDRDGDIYTRVDLPNQELRFEQFTYIFLNLCRVSEQLTVPVLQAQAYDDFAQRATY